MFNTDPFSSFSNFAKTQKKLSEGKRLLCRNRQTGTLLFILCGFMPEAGDLVAVRTETGARVEIYTGQPCLGAIGPSFDLTQAADTVARLDSDNANEAGLDNPFPSFFGEGQ